MSSVLYITRNGLLEPLGQSQVLSYLRGLSADYQITLISFEKPEDWADEAAMHRVRQDCVAHGIRWLPQRFHHRPKVLAPAWSMVVFFWLCLWEVRRGNAELLHARSYIPAAVAMIIGVLTRTPFIFDMRALWPEELITAGRLKRGSAMHRMMTWAERTCLRRAAAVVSLTDAAVEHLKDAYPRELDGQRIVVIPTCADLERFTPVPTEETSPKVYGCIGTVLSGWFRLDWLATFFQVASLHDPEARFEIVTRDNEQQVRDAIGGSTSLQQRLRIYAKPPRDMPDVVRGHDVSVMFFNAGVSKRGSSPTRLGEVLGCGIPVIANSGVGDVAEIVRKYRVGALVEAGDNAAMEEAFAELQTFWADPGLSDRCRGAAEAVFSLDAGTKAYRRIYEAILEPIATREDHGIAPNAAARR